MMHRKCICRACTLERAVRRDTTLAFQTLSTKLRLECNGSVVLNITLGDALLLQQSHTPARAPGFDQEFTWQGERQDKPIKFRFVITPHTKGGAR